METGGFASDSPSGAVDRRDDGRGCDGLSVEDMDAAGVRLASEVMDRCRVGGVRVAVAESLTGGLLADAFVSVPGASSVFLGSAVTYDVKAKASLLGVDARLLRDQGAVHPAVAAQMAEGVARLFDQPQYAGRVLGLSTTGVAGPGPDERGRAEGLAYVGVSIPCEVAGSVGNRRGTVMEIRASGGRERIRRYVVVGLLRYVMQLTGGGWE